MKVAVICTYIVIVIIGPWSVLVMKHVCPAFSYYNPLAVRAHPPVPASGVLHEKMWLSPKNINFFIKWSKTPKKRKISKKKLKCMCK